MPQTILPAPGNRQDFRGNGIMEERLREALTKSGVEDAMPNSIEVPTTHHTRPARVVRKSGVQRTGTPNNPSSMRGFNEINPWKEKRKVNEEDTNGTGGSKEPNEETVNKKVKAAVEPIPRMSDTDAAIRDLLLAGRQGEDVELTLDGLLQAVERPGEWGMFFAAFLTLLDEKQIDLYKVHYFLRQLQEWINASATMRAKGVLEGALEEEEVDVEHNYIRRAFHGQCMQAY